MSCGDPKKSLRLSSIMQIIVSFRSFEISEGILKIRKLVSVLIHFLTIVLYIWSHLDYTSLCIDYPVMCGHCICMHEDLPVLKKTLFIFVKNSTFFSMLYPGAVEYVFEHGFVYT